MLKIFTPDGMQPDRGAIQQMNTCMDEGEAVGGVLCADHHLGYSMPIGGAIAYPHHISPSGVGYDIGCGNKAVATSLLYSDIRTDLDRIMDEIVRRISFGVGQSAAEETRDHPIYERISRFTYRNVKLLLPTARKQLGTVGAGNHYVDLFREERTDRVWIGVHFGSRGFGHRIASGFLALAQGRDFDDKPPEGEMHAPPTLIDVRGPLGHLYTESMKLAGEYAYAGRDVVVDKVLDILGNPAVVDSVHNHHNFAWQETISGTECWVVRKGCTPLYPGQLGFVGGSMGENAVIIKGNDLDAESTSDDTYVLATESLYSAPHGAGRVMSRREAKGKVNRKTGEVKKRGKVDWPAVQQRLATQGIVLRGGDADEAPEAYKRLPEVLRAHEPFVEIIHDLRPIGVAMAGSKTFDPYKD